MFVLYVTKCEYLRAIFKIPYKAIFTDSSQVWFNLFSSSIHCSFKAGLRHQVLRWHYGTWAVFTSPCRGTWTLLSCTIFIRESSKTQLEWCPCQNGTKNPFLTRNWTRICKSSKNASIAPWPSVKRSFTVTWMILLIKVYGQAMHVTHMKRCHRFTYMIPMPPLLL